MFCSFFKSHSDSHVLFSRLLVALFFSVLVLGGAFVSVAAFAEAPHNAGLSSSSFDSASSNASWSPPQTAFRITIDASQPEGLYALDYSVLLNAGVPVDSLDPHTLQMFWMGQEIAIQVLGEADGHFDTDDVILFYGRNLDSLFYDGVVGTNKYTGDNVYWLSYGNTAGKRMPVANGTPAGTSVTSFLHNVHLEKNYYYIPTGPYVEGADHWFWQKINAFGSGSKSKNYTFSASNISSETLTGTLTVKLFSTVSGKTHDLTLLVNGHEVYHNNSDWVGKTVFVATAPVPQAYFQNGSNTLTVKITNNPASGGPFDEVYLNWLGVDYYDTYVAENDYLIAGIDAGTSRQVTISDFSNNTIAVFDVSDLINVESIANGVVTGSGPYAITFDSESSRLLATTPNTWLTPSSIEAVTYPESIYTPSDLLDTTSVADYIIITHKDFWDQAVQLANYRSREYIVAVVDVQQVYDQFNGGMMSAEAIHDFLGYTYNNWAKRPQFVLLIGDATYDMRHYSSGSMPTFIPVYLHLVGTFSGETAADNRFVTLESDAVYGDRLPDMSIGRFPVNTPAEAQAMVDKVIAYETATCNPMPTDVIFAADDEDGQLFWDYSDDVADGYADAPTNSVKYLPTSYTAIKKYLGRDCNYSSDGNATSGEECRQQLVDKLNNDGALLVSYVGHATKNFWAVEQIWNEAAVDLLTNTNGCDLPVIINLGCDEGYFHDPQDSAVSEWGVRKAGSGAVATISPTYYGLPNGHDFLEKGFFLAVFNDEVKELGIALTKAKQHALDNGFVTEPDGYLLMGDPATKFKSLSAAPLGMMNSSIAPVTTTTQLNWADVAGAVRYDVFRSTDEPYFIPVDPVYASDVASPWQDPAANAIGDPTENHYYIVRAQDDDGHTSYGIRHGEFDFALVPGQ